MVDELDDLDSGFSGSIALLLVDEIDYLEIQGEVGLEVGYRIACIVWRQAVSSDLDNWGTSMRRTDKPLQLRSGRWEALELVPHRHSS